MDKIGFGSKSQRFPVLPPMTDSQSPQVAIPKSNYGTGPFPFLTQAKRFNQESPDVF